MEEFIEFPAIKVHAHMKADYCCDIQTTIVNHYSFLVAATNDFILNVNRLYSTNNGHKYNNVILSR